MHSPSPSGFSFSSCPANETIATPAMAITKPRKNERVSFSSRMKMRVAMATKNGAVEMITLQLDELVYVSAMFSNRKYSTTPESAAPMMYHSCLREVSTSFCRLAKSSATMAMTSRNISSSLGDSVRSATVLAMNVVPQMMMVPSASRCPSPAPVSRFSLAIKRYAPFRAPAHGAMIPRAGGLGKLKHGEKA